MLKHLVLVVVALSLLLVLPSCDEPEMITPLDSPSSPIDPGFGERFFMGVLPIPADGQSFDEGYRQAANFAEFVPVWGRPTPFYEMAAELSGSWGQLFVEQYVRGNGMFPLIHLSFMGPGMTLSSPPNITNPTLSNPQWRQAYKQAALDTVRASRPLFLSLGNEVNRWYETYGAAQEDANGFQHYVSLYEEIYDEVKNLSPGTQVFCTFARELVSANREADMSVIQMFNPDKLDLLMLTSYPHAVQGVNRPSDIPDDYYSRLREYLPDRLIGFSEVAWPSLEAFGGEQGQADFLAELCGRLTRDRGVELRLLGWSWLHDLDDSDSIGLICKDSTVKLAYNIWKGISITGRWTTREMAIPPAAVKMTPETDAHPPILHSDEYEEPIPVPYPINTAGAEDSCFIMPDGNTMFLWFTPDPNAPLAEQLFDRVTGLYVSHRSSGEWQEPQRIWLCYPGELALDGAPFVPDDTMWFASARTGYSGMHWFTASLMNGEWTDWKEAGFNPDYQVGELHISADGQELYFHSNRPGGRGEYDIWLSRKDNGEWLPPENIDAVSTTENEGWPFLTQDGNELWFTRTYLGSPAIFRSRRVGGEWQEPELIISQFAAEPSLDSEGNIYFTHHFFKDGVMLEADYYVAMRRS